MPLIDSLRSKYTGYSDDEIVSALQATKYPTFSVEEVRDVLGVKPPPTSLMRKAADVGLAGAQGVVSGVKMFSDLAGADNAVSGTLDNASKGLGSLMSQARQGELQRRGRIIEDANASGDTWEQVKAYMGGLIEAPASTVAQGLGSIAPMLPAMLIGGPAAGGAAVARTAGMMGLGAAQGVGAVKGSTYERVLQGLEKQGMAPDEAKAKAVEAQSYLGPNSTDMVVAGVIGAMTGKIGAEGAIEAIVHGTVKSAGKTLPRVATGVLAEGSTEALQGGQEQLAGNRALSNAGIATDPMMGVVGSGLAEGAVGGIIGGALSLKAPRQVGAVAIQQATADEAFGAIAEAPDADSAIAAALAATDTPLDVPPRSITADGEILPADASVRLRNQSAIDEIRMLEPAQQQQALELQATSDNLTAAPGVRRYAQNALDALLLPVRQAPVGDATEIDPEVINADIGLMRFRTPDQIAADAKTELADAARQRQDTKDAEAISKPLPTGEATEIQPELVDLETIPTPEVIEAGGDLPLPEGMAPRTPKPVSQAPAREMTDDDVVKAVVDGFKRTNTPQARAFVGEFEAGRITPADVLKLVGLPRPKEATPDERLAAAAAQAPKPAKGGGLILGPNGKPWETRSGAAVQARRGGGSVVEVPDGFAVQPAQTIDDAAHAAATSPRNDRPEPTEAQKKAGNYPKGHVLLGGLDLSIENPAGSQRSGKDRNGKAWRNTLRHHYGYIKGTVGNDKDHVDLFVKPDTPLNYSGPVFVVDQVHPDTGKFDEAKVMLGFTSEQEARDAYLSNYARSWKGFGAITTLPMDAFKTWVRSEATRQPLGDLTYAGQDNSRADEASVVQDVAEREGPMQQPEVPVVPQLRRQGDQDASGVGSQLPSVSGSRGRATEPATPTGPEGQQQGIRARQRPVGDQEAAGPEPAQERGADTRRKDAGAGSVGRGPGLGAVDAALPTQQGRYDRAAGAGNAASRGTTAPSQRVTPESSANTVFTEDAAEAARARLKAKLGRLSSGLDPETMMDGITLAGYHIEKGARTFAAYARAMVEDLGTGVKPYLQSWYMAVRADPRAADFKAGMDKASAVEDLDVDQVLKGQQAQPETVPEPDEPAMLDPDLRQEAEASGLTAAQIDDATKEALDAGEPNRAGNLLLEAMDQQRAPKEAAAPPTADPFTGDYAALEGKTIEQTMTTDDGKTATMRMDAANAMRFADTRRDTLAELKACLGRAT
jgi:Inorganic Pyrophosphatase